MKSQVTRKRVILPKPFYELCVEKCKKLMAIFHLLKIRTSTDIFNNEKCKVTFGLEYNSLSEVAQCIHLLNDFTALKRTNSILCTYCLVPIIKLGTRDSHVLNLKASRPYIVISYTTSQLSVSLQIIRMDASEK